MREVFAASFRDRIVHHLFYNYTREMFERTFIFDSYSCIPGRGTHFGINRLSHHIRSVSQGYTAPCYVLKFDIQSYFMSINRGILLSICENLLSKKAQMDKRIASNINFIRYLLYTILNDDATQHCKIFGTPDEWKMLAHGKSLFHSPEGCGLPIGNLSSQLFSNIYLNELDQFVKRSLKCKHYGRYVDDGYIVSKSKSFLRDKVDEISNFLNQNLGLHLNEKKTKIYDAYNGISFLGSYLMPHRSYTDNGTLKRIKQNIKNLNPKSLIELSCKVNSLLGVMSHSNSYCLRKLIFANDKRLTNIGVFSNDILKFNPFGLDKSN